MLTLVVDIEPVSAQVGTAADLINGVNALRESQGLEPYTTSSYLMSYAQSHSDYMASLGYWTHTRADGTTAFDNGIKENVATGTNMSIDRCIYTIWADASHWVTMVGYEGGTVGAGVAVTDDNTVYYTLNVIPSGSTVDTSSVDYSTSEDESEETSTATSIPINPVSTNTPDESGIITHTVQYGETLYGIAEAYGVTLDQILTNNGLDSDDTDLYEGDVLVIQTATGPTATPTPTATPDMGTATPTPIRPTMTPYPTSTPVPTATPTEKPPLLHRVMGDSKGVGIGLIAICGLGLLTVIYLGFLKKS